MTELAGGRGPRGAGIGPGPRIIWRREARRSWHRGRGGRRWGARQPRAALAPDRRQRRWHGGWPGSGPGEHASLHVDYVTAAITFRVVSLLEKSPVFCVVCEEIK